MPKFCDNLIDVMTLLEKEYKRYQEKIKTNWRYGLYKYRIWAVEYEEDGIVPFFTPQGIDPNEFLHEITNNPVDYPFGGCPRMLRVAGPFPTRDELNNYQFS